MSTTATRIFYCTAPVVWPDYELQATGQPDPAGHCWQEFDSPEAREVHVAEAHSAWHADLTAEPHSVPRSGLGPVEAPMAPRPSGPPQGAADHGPTEKQLAFLASLAERKGVEVPEVATRKAASEAIEALKVLPDPEPFRRNRHPAPCSECRLVVPEGEGVLRKDDDTGRWIVGHVSCPIVDEPAETPEVASGYYAVEAEDGHLSFYRLTRGRKPGVIFLDLCLGGGSGGSLKREKVPFRNVDGILAKIAVDPQAAAEAFAKHVGRCYRCGRGLTNEKSRETGIGPECAKAE